MTILDDRPDTTAAAGGDQPSNQPALVINPAVSVLRSTDDEVVSYLGSRSRSTHRIADAQQRGQLADFVAAFATPTVPADQATAQGVSAETAEEFVAHLRTGRVLIPAEQARYSYLVTGLGLTPTEADVAIRVVGTGALATAVARQLSDLLDTSIMPIDADDSEGVESAFDGADLVVVATDRLTPTLCYDSDELSRATATPWQLVYLDGFELIIGPTFVPEVSANYYDFDAMDESARVLRTQYLYEKSSSARAAGELRVPAFIADLAASWATLAIAQHLWGKGSFLEGYVQRVDVERMQIMRDKVLRLPRNPVEMGLRNDLRHPFL